MTDAITIGQRLPERATMTEIALYTVAGGEIVNERFLTLA